MERAESLLKDIGMKEYEAKAFISIVKCGMCSAEQVNKMSRIPLTRVYETMQSLQKLGIVTVLNTRPKKYKLVSVDALNNMVDNKKRLMQQELERSVAIIKEIKNLVPKTVVENREEMREGFWIFKGRETAIRKITEEEKNAKKEILFFSDDFTWFPRFRKALEKKISDGTTVKVLINLNDKTAGTVGDLLRIGADVRGWDVNGLRGDIIDGKMTHIVSKIPRAGVNADNHYGEQGSDDLFMYDCLTTENPILVNMVRTYFDIFWWRGERPQGPVNARHPTGRRQGKRFK